MNRRNFLSSILAAGVAPFVVRAESLMAVRVPARGLITTNYPVLTMGADGLVRGDYEIKAFVSEDAFAGMAELMAMRMALRRDMIMCNAINRAMQ